MGIPKNEWLYWCRLCARDDAHIKVRDQDMVSIISKCFDVKMTFEEPELGSMLCEKCFSVIGQLVTFSDSVNKVQPIFELLRHSEPQDNMDVEALRREYGLSSTFSKHNQEHEYQDDLSSCDERLYTATPVMKCEPEAEEQYDDIDEEVVHSPQPVKRKRGRPRSVGSQRRKVVKGKDTDQADLEATAMPSSPTGGPVEALRREYRPSSTFSKHDQEHEYQDDLNSYDERLYPATPRMKCELIWTELEAEDQYDDIDEEAVNSPQPVKRKRGRPKSVGSQRRKVVKGRDTNQATATPSSPTGGTVEALRRDYRLSSTSSKHNQEHEYQDDLSSYDERLYPVTPDMKCELIWTELDDIDEEVVNAPQPVKRKRGRPKGVGNKRRKVVVEGKDTNEAAFEATGTPSSPTGGSYIRNRYACQQCNETFISSVVLRTHTHEMHGAPKRYVCDCCGKGLKTSNLLAEHKLVHTDARPCICPVCNAGFKSKARLRMHLETHGEPRFECNICGKKLQTRAIRNKHKFVHIDEPRFTCEICGSGCKNSSAMKIHLLSHTGLRPFVCKYCGKGFASNKNCRSHKLKKHPDEASMEDESESSRVPVPTLEELRAITREMAKSSLEKGFSFPKIKQRRKK